MCVIREDYECRIALRRVLCYMVSVAFDVVEKLKKLMFIDNEVSFMNNHIDGISSSISYNESLLANLDAKINSLKENIDEYRAAISNEQENIKEHRNSLSDNQRKINEVENQREFSMLSKQIELSELSIQLCEKRIKQFDDTIFATNEQINGIVSERDALQKHIDHDRQHMAAMMDENKDKSSKLSEDREFLLNELDTSVRVLYENIKFNNGNRPAIVSVTDDVCGGCSLYVPKQKQVDVLMCRGLVVCEHCGCILIGVVSNNDCNDNTIVAEA